MIKYPVYIEQAPVSVRVKSEERLAEACAEWTEKMFDGPLQRPGIRLHPRALLRFATEKGQRVPRTLCPHSWPEDVSVRLAIEQITMDTSGMQVRYLRNNKPWLEQPALYTDVFLRVQEARSVFREWHDAQKKANDEPASTGGKHQRNRGRAR